MPLSESDNTTESTQCRVSPVAQSVHELRKPPCSLLANLYHGLIILAPGKHALGTYKRAATGIHTPSPELAKPSSLILLAAAWPSFVL